MIDILLATYDGEKYLEEQLISLLLQSYQDFNIVVRDDGSKDRTVEILEKYEHRYSDKFTIVKGEPTNSAQGNFFELLKHSTAAYSMFCDQDDVWSKDKVKHSVNCIQDGEEEYGRDTPLLLHTDLAVADAGMTIRNTSLMRMQKLNPKYNTLNRLIAQNNVTGSTVIINRALRELVVGCSEALMHDWWIALTAAAFGHILYYPKPTVVYRQHADNEVGAKNVSSKAYIGEKLKNTDIIKESILDTYKQAALFLHVYEQELEKEQKNLLEAYIQLESQHLLHRFIILNKYRFFKSGLYRKVAQIIYG